MAITASPQLAAPLSERANRGGFKSKFDKAMRYMQARAATRPLSEQWLNADHWACSTFAKVQKATKAMKAMKAMKTMKADKARKVMETMKVRTVKRAMKKVSARTQMRHVFADKCAKTDSGLAKGDLVQNQRGKVVSKKKSAKGKKSAWIAACTAARKALNIKDFTAIKKGSALYKKAKELHMP